LGLYELNTVKMYYTKTGRFTLIFLLVVLFPVLESRGQNFQGKITDSTGQPIYGSTVFIKEANQGLACNEDGEFQITIPPGSYTVEYRCLGYESLEEKVLLKKNEVVKRPIILSEKVFELAQITITNKEDPAYEIMRKAIAKAPYYQNKVESYKAEAYIKGNMELTKVSGFVEKMAKLEEGISISDFKNKTFVQESYSEVEFIAPDNYKQVVKAFSSTIPNNFDPKDAMRIIQTSLYSPVSSGGLVSPLNPKAFSYYRFRYEGFSEDNGHTVNKIKIIPKLKDSQFYSGYIYIADQTWDIRSAEVSVSMSGMRQDITISYNEVILGFYMPTAYNTTAILNIMGIGGELNYISSIKYLNIKENTSDVNYVKEEKKKKKSLEIKHNEKYTLENDSLATKQDSLYWSVIRNTPLNEKEIASYARKDSMQQYVDSINLKYTNSKFEISDILMGGKIGGDSTLLSFKFDGLIKCMPEYNYVDGFWLGQKFEVGTRWGTYNRLTFSPQLYYTTARKDIIWKNDIRLKYNSMRLGEMSVSVGDFSADYNPIENNRFDNTLNTLFYGKNVSMLYRKKYVSVSNSVDMANGLRLFTGFEVAKRSGLENNTEYNFFNAKSKIVPNIYIPGSFDLTEYKLGLTYTPRHYYVVYKGRKYYSRAASPTFYAIYSEGFSSWQTNNSRYRKLNGGLHHTIKTDIFSTLKYDVSGGSFLGSKSRVSFPDFHHFNATDMFFITRDPNKMFMLLDRYEASTNDYWVEAHLNYNSKYILLKRLPFLQGKMFKEQLQLRYLYTPNKKNYNEIGYSIDMLGAINVGVNCSFEKMKYEAFGVRMLLNLGVFE